MSWQFASDRPIYAQLVEVIQLKILSGEYEPGGKLPSIRDLAAEAAVNPNTLQRAFSELEQKGLVHTQRTAGRFISEDQDRIESLRQQYAKQAVQGFYGRMQSLGYSTGEIVTLVTERMEEENL
ncbi:MAG: GntR family transcriptional regulator [Oscillospiraceae bacterium]|nr:GntR family transcriptional regulator [Oscillospiraceae bacterium]